jgi:RNA polymerase primary sigma factor
MITSKFKNCSLDLSNKRHAALSATDERTLCLRVAKGDQGARDALINANIKFVVSVAAQFKNRGVPVGDLVNEGIFGLITAAEKFNVESGNRFVSFAVWWIRQSITTALHNQNTGIKAPTLGQLTRALKVAKERNIPHLIESAQNRIDTLHRIRFPASLSKMAESGFDPEGEWVNPEDALHQRDAVRVTESLLSKLDEQDRLIVKRYFGFHQGHQGTLQEVADFIGLSRQRVEQRKSRCVREMKKHAKKIFNQH